MKFILVLVSLLSANAFAGPLLYSVDSSQSKIEFQIDYSNGTHKGVANTLQGDLRLDLDATNKAVGSFVVPISALTTGSATRDCHLQEALGLNYLKSDYPKEHVCDSSDKLPSAGKNAIEFPNIEFRILELKTESTLVKEKSVPVQAVGEWMIHGMKKRMPLSLSARQNGDAIEVSGESKLSLKDFGVEVKSAKILFLTIRVSDEVRLGFKLKLKPHVQSLHQN